ncbi:2-hydroxychromene-2-carboxylate isomerase [Burkholderia multivorans]|uniref:2-hydroxychromene-2-carboxylate isomerase n=1 Tax=Burkholderia multivorans TaxID=87883 RepID=UPI001C6161CA|nr:2-hydroxychromene-2-carboxylate isomerase [Burkholderia multivorans]
MPKLNLMSEAENITMERNLEFFFDFMSPFAYLAHQKLPGLAEQFDLEITYRPVELKQLKLAAGNVSPGNRDIPLKLTYLKKDMERWAEKYGVPINFPSSLESSLLNKGAYYAIDKGKIQQYVSEVWSETWGNGRQLDDQAVVLDVLDKFGWDEQDFIKFTASDEAQDRYDDGTQYAHYRGVFGVPTIAIGAEMWWGNDRLEILKEHLRPKQWCHFLGLKII